MRLYNQRGDWLRISVEIYDKEKGRIVLKLPGMDYVIDADTARRLGADLLKVMRENNIIQSPQQAPLSKGDPDKEVYQCPDGCGKTVIILDNGNAQCQICKKIFEPFDKVPESRCSNCKSQPPDYRHKPCCDCKGFSEFVPKVSKPEPSGRGR